MGVYEGREFYKQRDTLGRTITWLYSKGGKWVVREDLPQKTTFSLGGEQTGQTELTFNLDLVTSVPKAPVHTFLKNKKMTLDACIFVIRLLLLCFLVPDNIPNLKNSFHLLLYIR